MLHEIKQIMTDLYIQAFMCAGICGSDGMKINGEKQLRVHFCFKDINTKKTIVIEPLPSLPIIKDLVVDMSTFFAKYEVIKPYLIDIHRTSQQRKGFQSKLVMQKNYLNQQNAFSAHAVQPVVLQHGRTKLSRTLLQYCGAYRI